MEAAEIILADEQPKDLAPAESATLFGSDNPVTVVERATAVSKALMGVVRSQNLSVQIGPKQYLLVEAWTMMGSMVGVFPAVVWTRPIKEDAQTVGWEARVEAVTRGGAVVGAAEAMCLRSESKWADRDAYALRSMAQTRATSKALATCLRFVAVLAGYAGTPAEEMPRGDAESGPNGPSTARWAEHPKSGKGSVCPFCQKLGFLNSKKLPATFYLATAGPHKGSLQCNGRSPDGGWLNHLEPIREGEAAGADDSPINF